MVMKKRKAQSKKKVKAANNAMKTLPKRILKSGGFAKKTASASAKAKKNSTADDAPPPFDQKKAWMMWTPRPLSLKRDAFSREVQKRGHDAHQVKSYMKEYFTGHELSNLYGEVYRGLREHPKAIEAASKLKAEKGRRSGARELLAMRLISPDEWRSNIVTVVAEAYGVRENEEEEEDEKKYRGELEQMYGFSQAQKVISKGKEWERHEDSDGDSYFTRTKTRVKRRNKATVKVGAQLARSKHVDNPFANDVQKALDGNDPLKALQMFGLDTSMFSARTEEVARKGTGNKAGKAGSRKLLAIKDKKGKPMKAKNAKSSSSKRENKTSDTSGSDGEESEEEKTKPPKKTPEEQARGNCNTYISRLDKSVRSLMMQHSSMVGKDDAKSVLTSSQERIVSRRNRHRVFVEPQKKRKKNSA